LNNEGEDATDFMPKAETSEAEPQTSSTTNEHKSTQIHAGVCRSLLFIGVHSWFKALSCLSSVLWFKDRVENHELSYKFQQRAQNARQSQFGSWAENKSGAGQILAETYPGIAESNWRPTKNGWETIELTI